MTAQFHILIKIIRFITFTNIRNSILRIIIDQSMKTNNSKKVNLIQQVELL